MRIQNYRNSHSLVVGVQNGVTTLKTALEVFCKVKYNLIIESSNPDCHYLSIWFVLEMVTIYMCVYIYIHTYVYVGVCIYTWVSVNVYPFLCPLRDQRNNYTLVAKLYLSPGSLVSNITFQQSNLDYLAQLSIIVLRWEIYKMSMKPLYFQQWKHGSIELLMNSRQSWNNLSNQIKKIILDHIQHLNAPGPWVHADINESFNKYINKWK